MPTYDIGLEHVSLAFATKTIFTDVTQGVFEGDRIGIVGKNGDGKSTLLHLFRGAQEPDSGRVTKRGGLTFGMLDQRDPLDDNATIREAALEGRADYEWASDNTSREIVEALLGGMSLDVLHAIHNCWRPVPGRGPAIKAFLRRFLYSGYFQDASDSRGKHGFLKCVLIQRKVSPLC